MEGVVRAPSEFSITLGADPSMTATQEFVVPRSMPITFAIWLILGGLTQGPSVKRPLCVPAIQIPDRIAFRAYIGTGRRPRNHWTLRPRPVFHRGTPFAP